MKFGRVPLLVVLVAGGFACAPAARQSSPAPRPDGEPAVYGRADGSWALSTLSGDTFRLADRRGRVLFVNVWATWCAPCVAEIASIRRLRDSLADARIEFLLVSPEPAGRVRAFAERHAPDLPLYVERSELPASFGLRALPTTFVVDPAGSIVLRHRGAADWDDDAVRAFLRHLAEAALAGGEP